MDHEGTGSPLPELTVIVDEKSPGTTADGHRTETGVFYGYVSVVQVRKGEISVTAYDQTRHLKNKTLRSQGKRWTDRRTDSGRLPDQDRDAC